MIVRLSSWIVHESQVARYLEHVESTVIPTYKTAPGLIRVHVLQRPMVSYEEVLTVSLWRSVEDLKRFSLGEPPTDCIKAKYDAIALESRTYQIRLSGEGERPDEPARQKE